AVLLGDLLGVVTVTGVDPGGLEDRLDPGVRLLPRLLHLGVLLVAVAGRIVPRPIQLPLHGGVELAEGAALLLLGIVLLALGGLLLGLLDVEGGRGALRLLLPVLGLLGVLLAGVL